MPPDTTTWLQPLGQGYSTTTKVVKLVSGPAPGGTSPRPVETPSAEVSSGGDGGGGASAAEGTSSASGPSRHLVEVTAGSDELWQGAVDAFDVPTGYKMFMYPDRWGCMQVGHGVDGM